MSPAEVRRYKRWMKKYYEEKGWPLVKGFNVNSGVNGKFSQEMLKKIQKEARNKVTGEFDNATLRLIAPFNEYLVIVARNELGTKEWPAFSNSGEVRKYLKSVGLGEGYPWCAAFVTWCLKKAGYRGRLPVNPAYVPSWEGFAKRTNRVVSGRVHRGDLIVFDWEGDKVGNHIGIVTKPGLLGHEIATIEGNATSDTAPGGGVVRKKRYPWQTSMYIRMS